MCGIEYAPGPFAGRGGVSWCHLLLPLYGLGMRYNGRSRPSYDCADLCASLRGRRGEGDFSVWLTISHWPMALWTVTRILVFALSYGRDYTLPGEGVKNQPSEQMMNGNGIRFGW